MVFYSKRYIFKQLKRKYFYVLFPHSHSVKRCPLHFFWNTVYIFKIYLKESKTTIAQLRESTWTSETVLKTSFTWWNQNRDFSICSGASESVALGTIHPRRIAINSIWCSHLHQHFPCWEFLLPFVPNGATSY